VLLLQIPYIFLFLESKSLKKADSLKKQPKIGFRESKKPANTDVHRLYKSSDYAKNSRETLARCPEHR